MRFFTSQPTFCQPCQDGLPWLTPLLRRERILCLTQGHDEVNKYNVNRRRYRIAGFTLSIYCEMLKMSVIARTCTLACSTTNLESLYFAGSKCSNHTCKEANNKGDDQTARMRRLVCNFVVRIQQNQRRVQQCECSPSAR